MKIVHRVGLARSVSEKVLLAGFEAGWVESRMNNLDCGDKDSLGVFQQRPSQGWGTPQQILNVSYAAHEFFEGAQANEGRFPGYTAGQLAQSVQRSCCPERYDQAEGRARVMIDEARRLMGVYTGSPADFNGDGRDDVVVFTQNSLGDVHVSLSTGNGFGPSGKWHEFFAPAGETPLTGDFNGDGKDDIITFTHGARADAIVALSTGTGFGQAGKWHDFFALAGEVPAVGDVNGDGRDDIVVFTRDSLGDVYVALSNGSGFGPSAKWHEYFGIAGETPGVADVNGDGRADIVTFTHGARADVLVALSTGSGFGAPALWHEFFAVGRETARLGDFNGDGAADIATFTGNAAADVYVATSNKTTAFTGTSVKWSDFFGLAGEFPYVGDFNGDGRDDIVVFTHTDSADVHVGLSTGTGFLGGRKWHDFFGLPGETAF
ncbi:hypothetical protein JOF53_001362 [Crossiella equi]|uniref:FG-GAP repeat n=1 Tax=Crossiella equi TaxID=130796 RepID=A0ABS5A7D4_9PSEU|nr:hypothetical protein [Crossiella equi]